jgi:hypothetical protein
MIIISNHMFPIIMAKMTMTMNVAVQNMTMLIDNILPHKTCMKLGGGFLIKEPIFIFLL